MFFEQKQWSCCPFNYMGLFFDKSMKDKQSGFGVQKLNHKELSVNLNYKYKIANDSPFFETIPFLVEEIDRKNQIEKKKYHGVFDISYFHTIEFTLGKVDMKDEKCMICLQEFVIKPVEQECYKQFDDDILMLGCSHKFHKICLLQLIGGKKWAKCPICSTIFGHMTGDQPDGKITITRDKNMLCAGHPKGTIIISYNMHGGNRNGKSYPGTSRTGYLPDTPEGNQVLKLLQEAFERKLTFTVGRSVTTGLDNQIVWNGIHHKTTISGGAANFGYPDPTYLTRVKEELAFKGIVPHKK